MLLTDRLVKEKRLTALMVTHNLRHAVQFGDRLLMLHGGRVVIDQAARQKAEMTVDDMLDAFTSISAECGN